jgi:hypothetical protein
MLDLEYVQLNVPKVLALFNKVSRVCADEVLTRRSCSPNGDKPRRQLEPFTSPTNPAEYAAIHTTHLVHPRPYTLCVIPPARCLDAIV